MEKLIDEVCGHIHNFFLVKPDGIHRGTFNISDGAIDVDFLQENQYFRVVGSIFNDGVHKYPTNDMDDEEFIGEVWEMRIPKGFLELISEIEAWNAKYGGIDTVNYSPYTSESFNNYSYSKGSRSGGAKSNSASPVTWQDVFGSRLRRWKRIADVI